MTKDEIITYWISSSNKDFKAMRSLSKNGHYAWALFLAHLVLEKLLKAVYVKYVDINIPFTHDLTKIAATFGRTERPFRCGHHFQHQGQISRL